MPSRSRSFRQSKIDFMISIIGFGLNIILGLIFFYCMSLNNPYLRYVNRTLATMLLTFAAMSIAMHAVYGGFDVGHKKNKPVISAMISSIFVTDVITYVQLEIMNVNENYNDHLVLFGSDLLFLLLSYCVQVLVIILFVRSQKLPADSRVAFPGGFPPFQD